MPALAPNSLPGNVPFPLSIASAPVGNGTSPLPKFQYLVAFGNNALDDPGLITGVAAVGTVGAVNVWTDITNHVKAHTISRGRQHELARFESGSCTLDVRNDDGVFCSWNTQSPYFGLLLPMKPVQVRATWNGVTYIRFTGHVNAWPVKWDDNFSSMAQLQANDGFRVLSLADITNSQYKQTVLADSPTAYYRLGDIDAYARDSSGNGRTGYYVLNSNANGTGVEGVTGALVSDPDLAYDTGSQGYVLPPASAGLSGTVYSVEGWLKLHGQPGSNDRLYSSTTSASAPDGTGAFIKPVSGVNVNLEMTATDSGGVHVQDYQAVNVPAVDGNFHHFVWTRNGSTFSFYMDGVQYPTVLVSDNGLATVPAPNLVGLGTRLSLTVPALNAVMDEVALYQGVALTPTQVLNHFNAGSFSSVQSGARVGQVLTAAGWSAGARSLDAGDTLLQKQTSSLVTTKALTYLQTVEQTEDGALFMTRGGQVRFVSRSSQVTPPYSVSQTTYGDAAQPSSEVIFQPGVDLALDDIDLFNEAIVQDVGGMVQTASDATSIATYGRRTQSLSGLLAASDTLALARAQWLVLRFKTPVVRLRKLDHRPLDNPAAYYPIALNRELLDRVTVVRHGVPALGVTSTDPFVLQCVVERIDEVATADDWQLTYALANALPAVGVFNDTTFGRWSDTSPLSATITAGAGSLVVTIAAGAPSWTTTDVPLTIQVDQEQMTVSAIGALGGGTQTLTLSARGVNNTVAAAHTAGATVTPAPQALYGF